MSNSELEDTFGTKLRKFGESTSVRGIPRALKSKDRGLIVLWSSAVVVCAGLLIWQVSSVLIRYYAHETITSVNEAGYNTVRTRCIRLVKLL
jgi:Amiloride-sensitive sodium channel